MEWMLYVVAAFFSLAGLVCLALTILSLPGTWMIIGLALIVEVLDFLYLPEGASATFGWWVLGVAVGLALLGEGVELLTGAIGAKKGGASRAGMIGALVGGVAGAVLCTFLLPIPIVGTLMGALAGTFLGALIGEVTTDANRTVRGSMKPATGAMIGRVFGTLGKMGIGVVVWVVLSVAAFIP